MDDELEETELEETELEEPEPDEADFEESPHTRPVRTADRLKRTTSGRMLGAAGLAIEQLLTVPREQAPIEVEAPGAPPGGRETELDLDPEDPAASVVTFRPKR